MVTRRSTDEAVLTEVKQRAQRAGLPKIERRLHQAVDLASGRTETTVLADPPTVEKRVKQLADAGFGADPSAFTNPGYRLTPQKPYQSTPEAWLDAFDGAYNAGPGVDQIWWRLPSSFATEFMPGCNFSFRQVPPGPSVLALSFEAWPYQGLTGVVVIDIGAQRTEIEINMPLARTVDIGFVHPGGDLPTTMVFFRPGLIDFVFRSVSLGSTNMTGISPWPVVKKGSNGHPIKTLQYLLRARGQSVLVDGVFGPNTETAVQTFQTSRGLAADGIVGPITWPALVVQVKQGSQGDAVRAVQEEFQFRNQSGDPSKGLQVDGIFGPKTDAAVRGFQQALSLDIPSVAVDGIVGPVTWQALVSGMLSF
jgi:hypothetical protein